jgi:uncharacterized protein (TIGR03437 family)
MPLYFVSPTQINFQGLSFQTGGSSGQIWTIVVSRGGVRSDPVQVWQADIGIGIFTLDGSGCGRAFVANVAPDGAWSLNSPSNSAAPGQQIVVFANGLGGLTLPPAGQPAPMTPLYPAYPGSIDIRGFVNNQTYGLFAGNRSQCLFAGKAPGMIGVDQVNLHIPPDTVTGCSVPLQLSSNAEPVLGAASQRAAVSIHPGGGQCVDPPPNTLAELTWVRTVSDGFGPPPAAEALRATFISAIGKRWTDPSRAAPGLCILSSAPIEPILPTARICPGFEDYDGRPLNPGALSLQIPSATLGYTPGGDAVTYTVPLAPGTIHQGTYSVASAGSDFLGAFQTTINLPPPFQLKTQLSSGMKLTFPLSLDWTGGEGTDAVVRFLLVSHYVSGDAWPINCAVPASAGHTVIRIPPEGLGPSVFEPTDLIISMSSEGDQVQQFSAPKLTEGGRHGWSFVYQYKNVIAHR